nr:hypothetical protein [Tanacetum cinerariifolium]
KGEYVVTSVNATTDLKSPETFAAIPLKTAGDSRVLLGDVARVEMGAENYDTVSSFDGTPSVYIGIKGTPSSNPLDVIKEVRRIMPELESQLPPSLKVSIAYDATLDGLLDQPADVAGHGLGNRPCGGRRDCRGGKHPSAYRRGQNAAERRAGGRTGDRDAGGVDDRDPGRRLCAHWFPPGP